MLASGTLAALRELEVPESGYCRFELRWDEFDGTLPGSAPGDLAGASLLVTGQRGDGTPFVIRSERNDELRLDARDGEFAIDEATVGLYVGLDASQLFSGIDIDGAVVSGDGTIRIEPGSNEDILSVFDGNVEAAARLFDDDDGNGALDAGERDDDDVLAE